MMRTPIAALLLAVPFALAGASERNDQLAFEPNQGQTDSSVRYLARTRTANAFFTDSQVVLAGRSAVRLEFVGADNRAAWDAGTPTGQTTSYIHGRDPANWRRDVPQFARLVRKAIYPGIDIAYYGNAGRLEYDFLLAPHADPKLIRMKILGATRIQLEKDGGLRVETPDGSLGQAKPVVYQTAPDGTRLPVEGAFRVAGNSVSFALGKYDPSLPLAIDPVMMSFTYLGGGADDKIVASNGTFFAGTTASIDFPGASFGRRYGNDVVIKTGFNLYVIGGTGNDEVTAATFSYDGVFVVGYTDSRDFPTDLSRTSNYTTPQIWQRDYAGGATDGFFIYIASPYSYSSYPPAVYVSYIGTPGDDRVNGVSLTSYGAAIVGSTTAAGLPRAESGATPIPSGGMDGFLMLLSALTPTAGSPYISAVTYLGGSGDDRALAVLVSGSNCYVTGETNSLDFPLASPLFSTRNGSTDAFVTRLTVQSGTFTVVSSTLLGGSQADRGAALTLVPSADGSTSNLAIAGVTASPDLPVSSGAIQKQYGGGTSDIFIAQLLPDLSGLVSLTYYGGSAAEDATSMSMNWSLLTVGGWTTSRNFPLKDPLQPAYGGDPDDGFVLTLNSDGSLYQATYLGGSASDRVYGVTANSDLTVTVSGQTNSPNFTTANTTLNGPSDGFSAQIGFNILAASTCVGGVNYRTQCSLQLGALTDGSTNAEVTVTSNDPQIAGVAQTDTSPSQASTTLTPVSGYLAAYRLYILECHATGSTTLRISAPGYPSGSVRADCFPVQLRVSNYPAETPIPVNLWSSGLQLYAAFVAVDPNSPSAVHSLSAPAQPVTFQIANSNPAVGTTVASLTLSSSSSSSFTFKPLGVGATTLTFTSVQTPITGSATVNVVSPLSTAAATIASGYQSVLGTYTYTPPVGTVATVTSGDPTKLVLSRDWHQPGTASMQILLGNDYVYGQALATSGDVPVTISVPGLDPASFTVHLAAPALYCYGCAPNLTLALGATVNLMLYVGTVESANHYSFLTNPQVTPATLAASSSDTTVVTVSPTSSTLDQSYYQATVTLSATAAGHSTVTLTPSAGLPLDPSASPISVTVQKNGLRMRDIDVGKDLAGIMQLVLPANVTARVTVSVSDPNVALLSLNNSSAGTPSITYATASGTFGFYVQGLAASGQTQVTALVDGYDPITAMVRMGPAGFIWSSDSATATLYDTSYHRLFFSPQVLDSVSLMPLGTQNLRYGLVWSLQFSSSNSAVVPSPPAVPVSYNSSNYVSFSPNGAGSADLTIVPPPGFAAAAVRQKVAITVKPPSINLSAFALAKDTQLPLSVSLPGNGSTPLTLTSSDPSKVIFSTSSFSLGSGSVTYTPGSQQVYVQALAGQGTVNITATASGFLDTTVGVFLRGLGVGLTIPTSYPSTSTGPVNGIATTSTQSPSTRLALTVNAIDPSTGEAQSIGYSATFRPGISPPSVTVTSSNPNVGQILRSPTALPVSLDSTSATVDFLPLAPGDTTVSVVQPGGFLPPNDTSTLVFHVTKPAFATDKYLMAKDTFLSLSPALLAYVSPPTTNVNVTITSSDPSRVVLSAASDTNTSASVTKLLVAGTSAVNQFYVHALANNGTAVLTVSAPGYADSTYTIGLTDLSFALTSNTSTVPIRSLLQAGPQSYRITYNLVPRPDLPAFSYQYASIRPGVSVLLNADTSDPTVLAVDTPQIAISYGDTNKAVTARPVAIGLASLTLTTPPGYVTDTNANTLVISVEGAKLSLNNSQTLGKDLQNSMGISVETLFPQATPITVYSSDPSRLLVSVDAQTPGAVSVTINGAANGSQATVYIQALADNGSARLIASSPGYQSGSTEVPLTPSAVVLSSYGSGTVDMNSAIQKITAVLATLDPVSLGPGNTGLAPRPGVSLTAPVTSSNTNAISLDRSNVTFSAGVTSIDVNPRAVGGGTAVVSVGPLPGQSAASRSTAVVYTVSEPDLILGSVTSGTNLQLPLQIRLASRLPAPASDVAITVQVSFVAVVSNDAAVAGNNSIVVTIPAGQRVSRVFYLQGFNEGNSTLTMSGGSYSSSSVGVTIGPTALVFQEALQSQTINLNVGASASLTIVPVALLATTPLPGLAIRAGATVPLVINTTGVASVNASSLTLHGSDRSASVTVRGNSQGSGGVSLTGPATFQYPAANTSMNVVVGSAAPAVCDLTADGPIDVRDIQTVINAGLGPTDFSRDVNRDGSVNAADILIVLNAVFGHGCGG